MKVKWSVDGAQGSHKEGIKAPCFRRIVRSFSPRLSVGQSEDSGVAARWCFSMMVFRHGCVPTLVVCWRSSSAVEGVTRRSQISEIRPWRRVLRCFRHEDSRVETIMEGATVSTRWSREIGPRGPALLRDCPPSLRRNTLPRCKSCRVEARLFPQHLLGLLLGLLNIPLAPPVVFGSPLAASSE